MAFNKFLVAISLLFFGKTYAQVDDNSPTYRNIGSNKYFRIHYDNDFFTNSDYYYSQGISLEFVHPAIHKFFLTKLLIQPAKAETKFGIALNDFGYTPTSISSNEILFGDRPFAGTLYLKTFAIATNVAKQRRISSAISTGILGPAAGAKKMQTDIHHWLDNITPKGWQHQIRNDVIINYQIDYEQQIWGFKNLVLLNAAAQLQADTLKDKLRTGVNFMIGKLNNPYRSSITGNPVKKQFSLYVYGAPNLNLIGYDATLQGGVFNSSSPYTIAAKNIERITFQANVGLIIDVGKLNLEYCQSYLTREFTTGNFHRWAGIKVGFLF